ncbi:MAG: hypothetical protein B6229_09475 [Spirochaetaceae bacterium 4572_7]|nr:MAG: hypothetical protein B6229_09475 [Spirochaetaceae bacterium 4572_7]
MTITTLSFIKTGFDTKNREYIYIGISTTLLSLGLILMFGAITIFSGVTVSIMLIIGLISFLKSVHNITLWG